VPQNLIRQSSTWTISANSGVTETPAVVTCIGLIATAPPWDAGPALTEGSAPPTAWFALLSLHTPWCAHHCCASLPLCRARTHLPDLHRNGPASPGNILPHRPTLHREGLLIVGRTTGVEAGAEHFRRLPCLAKGPFGGHFRASPNHGRSRSFSAMQASAYPTPHPGGRRSAPASRGSSRASWTLLPFFWMPQERVAELERVCRAPRTQETTGPYDRRNDCVSAGELERIGI